MSLLSLQRDFRRHLLDEPGDMQRWVAPATAAGLAVYHNAYRAQLVDCMRETYAKTHAWLGSEAFLAAMRAHIEQTPPSGWTLGVYGAGFAETLQHLYRDDPEVAGLADLEWRLSRAFEARNAAALPVTMIAETDWDSAGLRFVPSLQTAPALTNAGAIWSALATGDAPPAAALLAAPAMMLVWRQAFTPCFRTIQMIEYQAIMQLAAGGRFADLCTTLVEARGEAEGVTLAGTMLGQWFADGLICTVITKDISCA
jgi:hypothetical protein